MALGARRETVNGSRENFLPDPVSPVINTDAEDGETCSKIRMTSCMVFDPPIRSPSLPVSRNGVSAPPPAGDPERGPSRCPQGAQHRGLEWFLDIPECACLDRRNDSSSLPLPVIMMAGERSSIHHRACEQVEPVHSGQLHVGNQDGGSKFVKTRQRVFRAPTPENLVAPPAQ